MRYLFGGYAIDLQRYEFSCDHQPIALGPKVFDLLVYLIRHRDRAVTKQELFDHLWPDQIVSDSALARCIVAARKAVGDTGACDLFEQALLWCCAKRH